MYAFRVFNELIYRWAKAQSILTFGELEFLTGFLLTEFLPFHHSWVSC